MNVLVVHKEENMRELIVDMIHARTHAEIVRADNATDALKLTDYQPINLIIADFQAVGNKFARKAKVLKPNVVIALAVDDPDEGDDRVDVKFKMMDLPAKLDEILALANHNSPKRGSIGADPEAIADTDGDHIEMAE